MEISEVKSLFSEAGISVSEWARLHGFSVGLVYQILDGKRRCDRGQSHRIAVQLGLKKGNTMDINEFSLRLQQVRNGTSLGAP